MAGKKDIVEQALKLVMGAGEQAAPVSRIKMSYRDVTKRVPELTEAAKRLQAGEIGRPEYSAIVDRFKPVEPYASVPDPASLEDMVRALTANKREKIGKLADYPEGHPVALRLDIPAYTGHGVWVPTIHDQKTFKSISHEPAAHITGAQFSIPENKALAVAAGGAKGPFATIDGSLLKTPPEVIHERAKAAMNDPDWVQVGMDPERHSYFYDRKTMQPVISAEEVIQVGPLVLARKPVYGNAESFKYAKGGSIREGYGPGGWVDDVVKMAGKVISGEGEDAAKAGIRAYQGSPHNFAAERLVRFPEGRTEYLVGQPDVLPDVPEGAEVLQDFPLGRMRMDKIGTGEGAQVYGHGLYLAEHEPIAVNYRDVLTDRASTFRVGNYDMPKWILRGIENAPDRAAAIAKYKEDFTNRLLEAQKEAEGGVQPWLASGRISSAKDILAGLDALETGAPLPHTKGRVYEVSLAADPKTDFINYDAPWEDQPQKVKDAFSYLAKTRPDGADLARRIEAPIFAQEASDMGVKGIQYLDAGSRGTVAPTIKPKDGKFEVYWGNDPRPVDTFATREAAEAAAREIDGRTRNYVVFDDKLISIIRKYGIAGASVMLGYNLMEQLDPKQALAALMADQDYQSSRPQRSMGGNNSISGALNVVRGLHGVR